MLKTKEYRLATLEYDAEKNILFYRVKQDITVDVAEIKEMIEYVKEFMGEKRHLALIDFGSSVGSTTEGRRVYAEEIYLTKYRIADAFLVKSLSMRLIANFFIKVTKPKIATRLFTSETEAIKWLENAKNSQNKKEEAL
ncbi:MAG: hypothetical protein JNJ41_13335 [Bacteroidia bacterium]|nr:hypothetical protein [Bacteroidia bacterium]